MPDVAELGTAAAAAEELAQELMDITNADFSAREELPMTASLPP